MSTEQARTLEGFERMFNNGELDYIEEGSAPGAVDQQEPAGTDCVAHLKEVVVTLRTAFPDLRFDVHEPDRRVTETTAAREDQHEPPHTRSRRQRVLKTRSAPALALGKLAVILAVVAARMPPVLDSAWSSES